MQITINEAVCEVREPQEIRELLLAARAPLAEVWLHKADGWPALCALINANSACLMYLRFAGDSGFATRNPDDQGSADARIEYRLANGQRDRHPASWDISTTEAVRAPEYFLVEEKMAPWLTWHQT